MTPHLRQTILGLHVSKGREVRREWDRYSRWYMGEDGTEPPGMTWDRGIIAPGFDAGVDSYRIDQNYLFAFMDTMKSAACPANPMMTVNHREARREDSARAREAWVNDSIRRDRISQKQWDIATYASLCGYGISKTTWGIDKHRPVTQIINPRNIFFDLTSPWEDCRYVIEAVPYTLEKFNEKVKEGVFTWDTARDPGSGGIPEWMVDRTSVHGIYTQAAYDAVKWVIVYEFWDFEAREVAYLLLDKSDPIRVDVELPYQYVSNPYSKVVFNQNIVDHSGLSDAKLISKHIERLNELNALELLHTFTTIPIMLLNERGVENSEEMSTSIQNASGFGAMVRVRIAGDEYRLEDVIQYTKTPSELPAFSEMRKLIMSEVEFTLGLAGYMRGKTGNSEMATELALVDRDAQTRVGRRVAVMEEWVTDIARKHMALWKEFFPTEQEYSVRGRDRFSTIVASRYELAFDDSESVDELTFDDEWFYDYECVAYSPSENDRLVQLSKLAQFLPILLQAPNVDGQAVIQKLLNLLRLDIVLTAPGKGSNVQMSIPGQPGMPGASGMAAANPGMPGPGGNMPGGLDQAAQAIQPPGASQAASQPKVR